MNRLVTGAISLAMTTSALWPVVEARMAYESESSHIGTYASIADMQAADTSVFDYYSGRTFTDPHEYAAFKRLPIGDAMDASAADIDALIDLATQADAGITAENYDTDRPTPTTMSLSVFADTIVEACGVVASTMTFDSTRDRAASTCERLEHGNADYERAGAWTQAISHFRRTCETEHAIIPEGIDPLLVKDYFDRTEPHTLDYIVPPDAVKAGDPGALEAKPIAKRWLDRIAATATTANCRAYDSAIAKPLYVNSKGHLVVDHRDETAKTPSPKAGA